MSERRRGYMQRYISAYLKHRRHRVTISLGLLCAVGTLLLPSGFMSAYWENFATNVAADLIGALAALVVINPFIARAELRVDSVLERFDHRAFIRQVADARRQILILTTWTDLLQGGYRNAFIN